MTCLRLSRSILLACLIVLPSCDLPNVQDEKPVPRVAEPALTAPDSGDQTAAHAKKPRPRHVVHRPAAPQPVGDETLSRKLVGLTEPEMTLLLGKPSGKEGRGPGRRWVYRQGSCVLAVAFYADVETRIFRSLSYEVRNDDNSDQGRRNCMAELDRRIGIGRAEQAGKD